MDAETVAESPNRARIKAVALPAEHGSWSLVIEPILLGLLVAPSWAGLAIGAAAFVAFLINQPLKMLLNDIGRGRRYDRTMLARRFVVLYGLILSATLAVAIWLAGPRPFLPLLLALPFLIIFVHYDRRPGRSWQAELSAPMGFSAVAAMIALAGGFDLGPALALWAVMIARSAPAVLYIRARLRLIKDKPAQSGLAITAHALALAVVCLLIWAGALPWTAAPALGLLLLRAVWGLSRFRRPLSVKALGFLETGFGLATVLLIASGYWDLTALYA